MNAEIIYTILLIIGSFISIVLIVNAFFLRGIYKELNDVKVNIAQIYADSSHASKEIDTLRERYHNLVSEFQSLKIRVEQLSRNK